MDGQCECEAYAEVSVRVCEGGWDVGGEGVGGGGRKRRGGLWGRQEEGRVCFFFQGEDGIRS